MGSRRKLLICSRRDLVEETKLLDEAVGVVAPVGVDALSVGIIFKELGGWGVSGWFDESGFLTSSGFFEVKLAEVCTGFVKIMLGR